MELDSQKLHDIRNKFAVSMGMLDFALKLIDRDREKVDLEKIKERIQKSLAAQEKLMEFFQKN